MITLKAKFIGKTSLGFTTGKEYNLSLDSISTEIDIESKVGVFPNEETLKCVYSNTPKFLENWEVLSINGIDTKSKHGLSGFTTTTGTIIHNTNIQGHTQPTAYSGTVGYSGIVGYSGTVGYSGVTGYSGTVGCSSTTTTTTAGQHTYLIKDFQSIANEIRSDMRNNKLDKILAPLTNGKNSLV